ncbi:MAG: FtsX-like permease family protein [Planctomycetota bacterium]
MGLAKTIARRSLLQRPGRTLFSILGIALGIATVVSVVTLDHNTMVGYALQRQAADMPDIELTSATGVTGTSDALMNLEGISLASKFFQNDAYARVGGPGEKARGGPEGNARQVQLFGIEAAHAAAFDTYALVAGRALAPSAGEVLVGPRLVEELGVELGDRIWLQRPAQPQRKVCEDGVLVAATQDARPPVENPFTVVGVLAPERLGRRARGLVVVVDFEDGAGLYRGTNLQPRYWAVKDPGVDLEQLKRTLAESYSYALNRGIVVGQAADERAFRTGVRMVGLLALVLGLYVIFHTLSMSLTERIGEVGTLHALGATRGQIARVFLVEAVLLSGFGALTGMALGVALAAAFLKNGITTLGVGKWVQGFSIPWEQVLPLALLGFGIALIGAVYPLVALRGADTLAALRGEDALRRRKGLATKFQVLYALLLGFLLPGLYLVLVPVVGVMTGELVAVLLGVMGLVTLVVVLSLLLPRVLAGACALIAQPLESRYPLAGRLASRALRDAPARVGVSAAALGLVAAGLVGLKGMTASLRGEVDVWADEAIADKVWIRRMPPTEFQALVRHLETFGGVVAVEKGNARQYDPFLLQGTSAAQVSRFGPLAADPALAKRFAEERTVVLSRRVAKDLDYAVGDSVPVRKANGEVATFEVLAISDAYGFWPDPDERMYGVLADHWMEKDFCVATGMVTEVSVSLGPGGDLPTLEAAVRDLYPEDDGIRFTSGAEIRRLHVDDVTRDFLVFDALLLLTAALAGLGVLNGQLLAALERVKEVGVLKALGVTRDQLSGATLIEAGLVGLVGGLLGVAIGMGATPVVVGALEAIAGLTLPQRTAGPWIAVALIGAFSIAVVAALYPIYRMNRFDAVRAVRMG